MSKKWVQIKGYGGLYYIIDDDSGRVKSVHKLGRKDLITNKPNGERFLRHGNINGYPTVSLSRDGITKNILIHRLIGEHFIPNPENKRYLNHINGNTFDFRKINLEWCTHKENMIHARDTGLLNISALTANLREIAIKKEKQVIQMDLFGNFIKKFKSINEAARRLNIHASGICLVCNNKRPTYRNYKFRFYISKAEQTT